MAETPTLASLWGMSPDARRATPDEMIANLLAENAALKKGVRSLLASRKKWKLRSAALRSSLEEARKERDELRTLLRDWLAECKDAEAAMQWDGEYTSATDKLVRYGLQITRAPSPRDER